jgi:hypothetical protein
MLLARLLLLLTLITALARAEVYQPKPGSPERKAIMDALRLPVSSYVGNGVTFTGTVEVSGTWAKFTGGAAPTDGKAPKGDKAEEMELDLFALLRKEGGQWKVLSWAFSGDISAYEDALKKFPKAPKDLMPPLQEG